MSKDDPANNREKPADRPKSDTRPGKFWQSWVLIAASVLVIILWYNLYALGMRDWDDKISLEKRGVLGDSFGLLSAIFTGLALIGAGAATYFQWVALREERIATARNAVESRFFQLLTSLQNAVNSTRVGEYEGRQALRKVAEKFKALDRSMRSERADLESVEERRKYINECFTKFYHGEFDANGKEINYAAGDLLGHLFRLIYHIVKYVDESVDATEDHKRFYIRILRAHLSNPELLLLLYNAISDYGSEKMLTLIEQHDLLQNIDLSSLPDVEDAAIFRTLRTKVELFKSGRDRS